MNRYRNRKLFVAFAGLLAWGLTTNLYACSVPVFRYALERWERDEYRLIVAVSGELSEEHQKWVEDLRQQCVREEGFCNLMVHVLDITDEENSDVLEAYPAVAEITEPTAFLLYPLGSYLPTVILHEPFTDQTVQKLTSSAFVKELTLEILKGTSAVWVLVDSGNPERDDKAYDVLLEKLEWLSDEVPLPAGVIETSGEITGGMTQSEVMANYDPANFLRSVIPLKIGFAVKRLTKAQAEPVFRAILMSSEEDLVEYKDEPMAFPVFGRGRFLLPLVGEGISADNVEMATMYVCGICSCQIKSGNPGVDLLSHVDWYSYLEGSEIVHDRELPPLTGTADLVDVEADAPEMYVSADDAPADDALMANATEADAPQSSLTEQVVPKPSSLLRRNMIILLGTVLCLIVGASLIIAKKKKGPL
ncbi:hypothetical protein CA13_55600 [Planctomycetes bacterium CA13]|uniref:Uncharacterized protein n=1 Tax=Novipirellula herctigrandis TaxID=2527986 RepID=A0A5C5Z9T5_9BACT|nr:hypothetical protein CA13_55600 [Planctomycetes bacterium CA13]